MVQNTFFIILFIIALFAVVMRLLSIVGAVTALTVGMVVLTATGWENFLLLLIFFLTSSLFSKFGGKKKAMLQKVIEKGGSRDALQVLANGAPALAFSIAYFLVSSDLKQLMTIGFIGAIA